MASNPLPRTASDAPAQPAEAGEVAAATTTTPRSEQHLVKEGGNITVATVPEEEAKPHLPRDDDSEAIIQEHEQKINRYQAILAARMKAKFFSKNAFDGGNIYEAETIVEGGTIQSSKWSCTRSFANPEFFSKDKNNHEKGNPPSSATDSSTKNSSPPLSSDVSPKNNASALAIENNPMHGKRQQSKKSCLDALTLG